jgi:hypothetical protein
LQVCIVEFVELNAHMAMRQNARDGGNEHHANEEIA